jgi:hypothetical protein
MIYRALGDGQREFSAACNNLSLCCTVLHSLSKNWTGVRGVSKLARKLWNVLSDSATSDPSSASATSVAQVMSPPTDNCGVEASRYNGNTLRQHSFDDGSSVTSVYPESTRTLASPPQLSDASRSGQYEPPRPLPGFDPTFFQLDTAFNDLFDGGVPNFFRPHTAWEFLHALSGESPQEIEMQYPNGLDSFGYGQANQSYT